MTIRKGVVAGAGVLAMAAGGLIAVAAPPAEATTALSEVTWSSCVPYSDGAIESLGVGEDQLAAFRALLARTQCGTVRVPLDYTRPNGTKITVAITRLLATDQKHKLGSIAMNPGGPGGSGYLMPQSLLLRRPQVAQLSDRYDLIGFDPRGVGYSTKVDCPAPGGGSPIDTPLGPIPEATAP